MFRIPTATFAVTLALTGCAHDYDRPQTTTTTGATPEGVRVTNVRTDDYDPAAALAGELCRREAACGRLGEGASDEAKLLGEQNCVTERRGRIREVMRGWSCSPAAERARFEECLAAVRSERCETNLARPDTLPLCRANTVCGG